MLIALLVAAWYMPAPAGLEGSWRTLVLVGATILTWATATVSNYVGALALLVIYNGAQLGPASVGLSGFSSSGWFLLVGTLALGAGLVRCGLLERLALWLLLTFPPTFRGQVLALALGGVIMTPALPLTVARCALVGPLAAHLAHVLGHAPRSRPAVGLGLAAFLGTGLLGRSFLSGAALNLIAWHLLPEPQRLSWLAWAVAAAPATVVVLGGCLAIILVCFRPVETGSRLAPVVAARLSELGPIRRGEWIVAAVMGTTLCGLIAGPWTGVEPAWIAAGGTLLLALTGTLTDDDIRTRLDWPLLIFLGAILSLPAILHDAGIDERLAQMLREALPKDSASPAVAVSALFLATVCTRFLLSEWVGVPLLTVIFLPFAGVFHLHQWVIVFVVLVGSNLWLVPYQFSSYVAFLGSSDDRLFRHRQVWPFSLAYLVLSLLGLLVSLPFWRLLRLLD